MAEKNSYLTLGVAIAVGLIVGAALGARNSGEAALMGKRLEAQFSEQTGAIGEQVAALEARLGGLSAEDPRVEALDARVNEIEAQAATLSGQIARVTAVDDRVTVLAEQMAGIVAQLQALDGAAPAAAPIAAPAPAETPAAAAPSTAATPAAGPNAPSDDPSDDPSAALMARLGEGGAALSIGETATFGGAAVFLSRVDVAARDAHVVVVGRGPATIGDTAGALTLDDGCALTLVGVLERRAFLQPVCPQ